MDPFKTLKGRVAMITGAGRGIGRAIAEELVRREADLILNDLDEPALHELKKSIEKKGRRVSIAVGDISNHANAKQMVTDAAAQMGGLHIVVNNAGITRDAVLSKMSEEVWDEVIRVNLKGPFNVGQAAAEEMKKEKWGRIINLASVAWLGNVGQTNYAASKAGVVGMTRTWALELAKHGITANAVAPGLIDSVLTQKIPEKVMDQFRTKIPLGRIGKPEDIAGLVGFLASDAAGYMTGQVLTMDGGLSVGI